MKLLITFAWLCLATLVLAAAPASAQMPPALAMGSNEASAKADVDALIRILEDDAIRRVLIERLRAAAAEPAPPAEPPTFARWLAEHTADASAAIKDALASAWTFTERLGEVLSGTASLDLLRLWEVLASLGSVMVVAFLLLFAARLITGRSLDRTAQRAQGAPLVTRLALALVAGLVDAIAVISAWGAGYLIALQLGGEPALSFGETLFLNALVMLELGKVGLRFLLAPRHASLRPLPLDDTDANYWYFWLSRLVSLIGYTFLFVAPLVATTTTFAAARAVRVIVLMAALFIGIAIILQNRDGVRARLASAGRDWGHAARQVLLVLSRVWHVLAIVYLVALFAAWLSNPLTVLPFMLKATVQTGIAVLVGSLVMAFISRALRGGMSLPQDVKARLPLLEARLNAFIPSVLRVARTVVLVIVMLAIADAWAILDLEAWFASETGRNVVGALVSTSLVLILGWLVYVAVSSWVEYRLSEDYGRAPSARERTLLSLFRNAFTVALVVLVGLLALSELGVNIGPLLAGAGVIGLAVSFGSQKLVQDIITGAFIQIENAMNEGDVVSLGSISGVVEKLTIRSVGIRDLDGVYHLVPFSAVTTVSNFMRGFAFHVAEIRVAYREDIPQVKEAMQEAFDRLTQTPHGSAIIGPLEMHGVTALDESAVKVRARIRTVGGQQWAVGRAYNEILKAVFDERDIEIPYPHVTVYMGRDKRGDAPPLRLATDAAGDGDTARKGAPAASDGQPQRRPSRRRRSAKTASKSDQQASRTGEKAGEP
ncbi:mechanosensitive ion channel domain-containing protein [Chelatococcus composti]|uniref:Small conductance mechanosensitive channel n=1 Tax=Chelatococcus composti TaxID=1743235 RepID=A0A841K6A0_9HYPH|nr:mechanosensitive ion channel domain-containing protein [Chelatococcus composti]MBB6168001.1 small conductance mechanosensitive channel [Chelatococcus composti]MBS7734807.1 mechanosensitive ion channel [Chelatococcus composti]GGG34279.1 mechanosensitive ion channel protein MscS [Chelatococcus composti]